MLRRNGRTTRSVPHPDRSVQPKITLSGCVVQAVGLRPRLPIPGNGGVPRNGFRCVRLTGSANDGSVRCPACSSPIVITIAAAVLDELDRRVCRSCCWSAYVDGSAHGRGYLRRSSP